MSSWTMWITKWFLGDLYFRNNTGSYLNIRIFYYLCHKFLLHKICKEYWWEEQILLVTKKRLITKIMRILLKKTDNCFLELCLNKIIFLETAVRICKINFPKFHFIFLFSSRSYSDFISVNFECSFENKTLDNTVEDAKELILLYKQGGWFLFSTEYSPKFS